MTRVDIFSGFLGAGKTTLIRKLISEGYKDEKLVLIENEFGEIAIDGGFLKDAGVQITEMNSGCICCTLVGDFTKALKKVVEAYSPDRIIIEPSGVGKLSDVSSAVEAIDGMMVGCRITVVDAVRCKLHARNFGEFFNDQVANADIIVLSRTDAADQAKTIAAVEILKAINDHATVITTPWPQISGEQIVDAMNRNALQEELEQLKEEHEHHHHHHHDDDDDEEECCHHHHHHDDDDEEECCHHHHDDDEDEEHEHHHHHHHDDDDDEEHDHHHEHHHHEYDENGVCSCGHHHGEGHHHHHADEVFSSWGLETAKKFTVAGLEAALSKLEDNETYGTILRAKGIVDSSDGEWIYFDYVPGETDIRRGAAELTGRFCVIGSKINETALKELFEIG